MLKPRNITAAILLFFVLVTGIRHFTFSLSTGDSIDPRLMQNMEEKFPLLPWIERNDYDIHLRAHTPGKPNPDVVIVDINERSMAELGQFPFSRKLHAKLIQKLEKYGAKVAAFDITFPEKERNDSLAALISAREEISRTEGPGSRAAALIQKKIEGQDGDETFAAILRGSRMPVILGYAFAQVEGYEPSDTVLKVLSHSSLRRVQVTESGAIYKMDEQKPVLPHSQLLEALPEQSSIAYFTAEPDQDSVIRQASGTMSYRDISLSALAVKAVEAYLGEPLGLNGEDGLSIRASKLNVPLSPKGSILLRYYGGSSLGNPRPYFRYIEYADVISDNPATAAAIESQVKGKIVFVGTAAIGLKDIRANPFSKDYPGVEVHATLASNMLNGTYMVKDQRYFLFGYAFILLLGLIVSALVYRMQPLVALGLTLALAVAFQFACQDLFFDHGLVVPTFLPCLAALAVFVGGVLYRYFTEEQEKKKVRNAFGRYVSGPVVEEILRDQSKLRLGGQKKVLTVMFCDLVGFTKMSEHMDAEKLTLLLNEYFTRMTRIILANQGTLDKYMGDAVMCFWGAPLDIPDHARLACKTALEMTAELEKINAEWKQKHDVTIGLRIGIHTGEMNVGNMGSEQVFSYTVMGDNVNLGSRLEGVNNVYGTQIMVSAATAAAAGEEFMTRTLDNVRVKGKEEAVEIRELLGFNRGALPEWMQAFADAVSEYQRGDWEKAEAGFTRCLELKPGDAPSGMFLERVKELREHPPKDWDGTWTLSTK